MSSIQPHVMVVGLRGFPDVQGGVETHAMHLFPAIAADNFKVTVVLRSSYIRKDHPSSWKEVGFLKIWAPKSKYFEAVVHTFIAVLHAAVLRPDILHIQAIGPALLTPLARLLGLKVIVTHHGQDYYRQKWGLLGKFALRSGELLGMKFANERICVSQTIHSLIHKKYGLLSTFIPNGVDAHVSPLSSETLSKFNLTSGKYVLMVSRLVPEKRHIDLINAFRDAALPEWKLVLVGSADHADSYSRSVEELAKDTPNVIAAGFQYGVALEELYANAGVFVLPSSHEGLPIVLLEALSYGIPVVISDIAPHLEVALPQEHYFPMGDTRLLAKRIQQMAEREFSAEWKEQTKQYATQRYSWGAVAQQTITVYRNLLGKKCQ